MPIPLTTVPIGLAGPSYLWKSLVPEASRCVNYYPEVIQSENGRGVSKLMLQTTPGLISFLDKTADAGVGKSRGLLTHSSNILIAVFGPKVYTVTTAGVGTLRGTISDDGLPVSMHSNLVNQVFITSGGLGYILDMSTLTLTQITDPDFPNTVSSSFLDQYFIALRSTAQQFYISSVGDGLLWDALDFATIETSDDAQKSVYVDRDELWFFGEKVTNIYYNSGNSDFPFDPRPGAIMQFGIGAPKSITRVNSMLTLLGINDSGWWQVPQMQGYSPVRVSDDALEHLINDYTTKSDAIGFAQGDFYWLYFPTENVTWVLDTRTKMWHQRMYFNTLTGQEEAHRACCAAYFAGKHIVGDRESAKLYELSDTTYTDVTAPIYRIRRAPHIMKGGRASEGLSHHFLRVYCQTGVGLLGHAEAAGVDPKLLMRYSDDGANTWSDYLEASIGAMGQYGLPVEWRQLGSTNFERTYEITTSEPVPHVLLEAYVGVS